jgi:magnesium chelatase family protein
MIATILSRAPFAMEAPQVSVEVHLGGGLPLLSIVGLPEGAVKESKDRVRSAITTANFDFPAGRITVNLAPADLPKEGGRFDLPIALGVLAASEQIPGDVLGDCEFYGELSLSGEIKPVRGVLPAVCQAAKVGHRVIVPAQNFDEARLVEGAKVACAAHLLDVCAHIRGTRPLQFSVTAHACAQSTVVVYPDLSDVRGQAHARRALEIAAAGSHSILFIGPPGAGKSMLAHRLPGILPPMAQTEAMETATVASVSSRGFRVSEWGRRPFRAPHHTASAIALTGGGSHPRPGEISLAHNGVLFLDELPEFSRHVLEVLREPLESGSISISRSAHQAEFPARFQLVAAMNPCPCGYLGERGGRCRCSPGQFYRYRSRISGPLLDRLDLHIALKSVDTASLSARPSPNDASAAVAARVIRARYIQAERQQNWNAHLENSGVHAHCLPDKEGREVLERAMQRFGLSARAYHRILKVARTIADLDGLPSVSGIHVGEAVMYRQLDRSNQVDVQSTDRSYVSRPSEARLASIAEGSPQKQLKTQG